MAYRADFYTAENIIGYTGVLRSKPTVYFRSDNEYGHITQEHDEIDNVGREVVGTMDSGDGYIYVIRNEIIDGAETSVEGYVASSNPDGPFLPGVHTSRGKFTSTLRANIDVFALLAQAIWSQTEIKPMQAPRVRRSQPRATF